MYRAVLGAALIASTALSACSVFGPDEETVTLYVAPQRAECTGLFLQMCLLVKERPDQSWQYFYDSIQGFEFEAGHTYKLLVIRRRIENPVPDGSSVRWRLIRVLEKIRA
ncbi:MAG: DUF4377 domain-containing protein [Longimicrobiales bacterium]